MNQNLKKIDTDFGSLLSQIDQGFYEQEVQEAVRELVIAIQNTGKKGTLSRGMSITPKARHGALGVKGKVKLSKPEVEPLETNFFPTPEGNLTRRDPRQITMFDQQPANRQPIEDDNHA